MRKRKITKITKSEENSYRKLPKQMAKSKLKHTKRMDNNCHIPAKETDISNVQNGEINLVL